MAANKMLKCVIFFCAIVLPSVYGMSRIVGGQQTTIDKHPYQVSLQYLVEGRYQHSCGGSIISTRHVLTAAHCYSEEYFNSYFCRVNSTNFQTGGTIYWVTRFLKHPLFHPNILDYDFGIAMMSTPFVLGPNVAIIPLTTNDHSRNPPDNTLMTISGWGITSETNPIIPFNLREAKIPVFNHRQCRNIYPFLTNRHTCLGGTPEGMLSACFGDSGGPAVLDGVQYFVVSGGNSCEKPGIPGLYGTVSRGRDWIYEVTGV